MSAIQVLVESRSEGFAFQRTQVTVDGKFVYQTGNHTSVEKENLQRLFDAMVLEIHVEEGAIR